MKTIELLAPAGSMECLIAAVQNGCDAVYLGGEHFGARSHATFKDEQIIEAIQYAHRYGVKVYVTMNVLIYEQEIEEAITFATFLYRNDVDAILVQDLGLLSILHQILPDLEVHASTQMHIHNPEGIEFVKNQGVSRVVLPRETTIEDIKLYSNLGVEIEVFIHGALCVAYSGQCLMSSLLYQRSGNRGDCGQPCRMRYKLVKEHHQQEYVSESKYLLSPKDLMTIEHIPELMDAGVTSFKIEGRMKRPEYVAYIVKCYRAAIDAKMNHQTFILTNEMQENMNKLFSRGFSSGHMFHQAGSNLMNVLRPNHLGIEIGKVVKASSKKVSILLTHQVHQHDGIRILGSKDDFGCVLNKIYINGLLVSEANIGDTIEIDCKEYIEVNSKVLLTSDMKQLISLQKEYHSQIRRVDVYMEFTMNIDQKAILTVFDDDGFTVSIESEELVEKAHTTTISQERIVEQLNKVNNTMFSVAHIQITSEENSMLKIKEINQMRRIALHQLQTVREKRHFNRKIQVYDTKVKTPSKKASLNCIIQTQEQFEICEKMKVDHIYTDNILLYRALKQEHKNILFRGKRVVKHHQESMLIQEYGSLYYRDGDVADASCNVYNSYTLESLYENHIQEAIFSLEMDLKDMIEVINAYQKRHHILPNTGAYVYGREVMMVSEYCPINMRIADNDKKNCSLCKQKDVYYLENDQQEQFPLLGDEYCRMHIYNNQPRNEIDKKKAYKNIGIENFYLLFTIENKHETETIIESFLT